MIRALMVLLASTSLAAAAQGKPASIRVVSDDNYPPYLFLGSDHLPRGYLVDEWQLWEKKTGIHVDLIATDWANAQRMLLDGQADVIEMLFKTPDREGLYDFTEPYARVTVGIYADSSISGIDGVGALKGFEVGVEQGDACIEHLRKDGITSVKPFRGYTDMIAAANKKEVRILCMDDYPANYYLYRMGDHSNFSKSFEYYAGDFHRGVRKGNLQMLALVDQGMNLITPAERETLKKKWMGQPVSFTPYAQIFAYALVIVGLGGIALMIWVFTLRRAVERRTKDLGFLAYHDALTQLPNRYLLIDRINYVIKQRDVPKIAFFLIDLDYFKRINEGFGHAVGDLVLKEVAGRLENIAQFDTVARIGGDAFAATIQGALETATITATADNLLRSIGRGFSYGGDLFVGASIGISVYPDDGPDGASLLKHAEAALGLAKREGRGHFRFYQSSLTQKAKELLDLGAGLRRALQCDEFLLLYQPQVEISTQKVVGVEALLRWQTAEFGLVSPGSFIPYAEESGLIGPIGDWVLRKACHQLAQWLESGLPRLRMAVNLSPRQFGSVDLIERIVDAADASGISPDLLEIEITEGILLDRGAAVLDVLSRLRALGVTLAIDDFGTGYSSLAYLHRLPIQLLKIDKSFLTGLPTDEGAVALTSAIIAMASNLNIKVLAEGVESGIQWTFLKHAGCDYAQGWHVGVPMTAVEFESWFRARTDR